MIKSAKISINEDHTSAGYGFVCFEEAEPASAALEAYGQKDQECYCQPWKPRDVRDVRKLFNNLYVKNYPSSWRDDDLHNLFFPYGDIGSLIQKQHENGNFAFVCYMSQDKNDHEYGPMCAGKAIEALHGRDIEIEEDKGKKTYKLYVSQALPKPQRELARVRDTFNYKKSKKRCNLYVKGFDPRSTADDLRQLFSPFGEIESIKILPNSNFACAFICFKTPDQAQRAK